MNVAIPTLDGRVSPVFDVAHFLLLVELDRGREVRRTTLELQSRDLARRVAELSQHRVGTLVCGAISRPLEAMLLAAGIQVIPQVCGLVEEVLAAYVADRLHDPTFLMPGCCGRRRRGRRGPRRGEACRRRESKEQDHKPSGQEGST